MIFSDNDDNDSAHIKRQKENIFLKKIADIFYNLYTAMEKSRFLSSIKKSFTSLIPMFMCGAFALLLQSFPVAVVQNFIKTALNGTIDTFLDIIYNATYGIASIYLVFAVTINYSAAIQKNNDSRNIFVCFAALASYFALLGPDILNENLAKFLSYTNMSQIFSALIVSLLSTRLFYLFSDLYEKLRKRKGIYADFNISAALAALLPLIICVSCFSFIAILIDSFTPYLNFNAMIIDFLSFPFRSLGKTYPGGFLIIFMQSFLWLFGIHGNNVFDSITTTIFAYSEDSIVCKPFWDCFVLLGGSGSTLCLLIAILLFSKNKTQRQLCHSASIPMLFNINEIMTFGIPLVLNPVFFIPFLLVPLANYTVSYLVCSWGWVPSVIHPDVQWTTPIFLSGYQATDSVAGIFLQLFNLILGVAIYSPFVYIDNFIENKKAKTITDELTDYIKNCEIDCVQPHIFKLNNHTSRYAAIISEQLQQDVNKNHICLYYQPQVSNGKIVSMEALFRWTPNESLPFLYPPLLVDIATENDFFCDFSKAVILRACEDLKRFLEIAPNLKLSVNLRLGLLTDEEFLNWLIQTHDSFEVPPGAFGIEITEETNLSDNIELKPAFDKLQEHGIDLLMDDFSMGHTSLSYLRRNHFNYVKLDGQLVRDIDNDRSRQIINSIVVLGQSLQFQVIAEYVETEKQRKTLENMGCHIYQGYLYSPAVDKQKAEELLALEEPFGAKND